MTDTQLIIIRSIVERVKETSKPDEKHLMFNQTEPLQLPMQPTEYDQLQPIIDEIDAILADIPELVAEVD